MVNGTAVLARPTSRIAGMVRNGSPLSDALSGVQCRKRDKREVSFDVSRIETVLRKCFTSVGYAEADIPGMVERITNNVVKAIASSAPSIVDVEEVQRYVVQQLFVADLFDAAEHYQNYRESHRLARINAPISPEAAQAVANDRRHFPSDLQYFQLVSKFARWNEEAKRRETWDEVCTRVMYWFAKLPGVSGRLRDDEWTMLREAMYGLKASPAMRVVQMAGPALDRCNVGVYNCAYHPIKDLFALAELLYILMQGSGNGFTVEYDYIADLPRIRKQKKNAQPKEHVIEDSTEGWCDALFFGLTAWFNGEDVTYDYSKIRPAGARLKTKGGRASGPEPLRTLLTFARDRILARQGKQLPDIDVHDLCCMIGKIVQVGGVRRASCISLSDLDSTAMRHAKSGNWYEHNRQRTMANNSAVYNEKPSVDVFMEEWLALMRSGSGERGICNRYAMAAKLPKRRKDIGLWGMNPCGEIILRPFQFCNLSIAIARPDDTEETLTEKVRIATYFGVMQSTATNFRYIRPDWKKNCEEERLLGVDITGHADCPLIRDGAPGRDALLQRLKKVVHDTKAELAKRFEINESTADTTVKPSGDSSVFFDCGSGISARFAQYQWRWCRESKTSPLARFLVDQGVPHAEAPEDASLFVFGFPRKAPEGCLLRDDQDAIQQLENWLLWKRNWAEHSVSATIYIRPDEWFRAGAWVYDHFDEITGLSFMPKDNGTYRYAPNEEMTKEQYEEAMNNFPEVAWEKLCRYETEDNTESAHTLACVGGSCDL